MLNHIKDPEGKTIFQESGSNLKNTVIADKEGDSVASLKLKIQQLEQTLVIT